MKNLTNYNISGSHEAKQNEIEEEKTATEQEEMKNLEAMLQRKRDLEENYADEILFNKIAFDPVKKPVSLSGFSGLGRATSDL